MIAGVVQVKDEADIIGSTVGHLLDQGVDRVWAMDWFSEDATRDILAGFAEVTVLPGSPAPFYWAEQGNYNTRLAQAASDAGAEWIIPFDADEYWTGTHDRTVKEALDACPQAIVQAKITQYVDFDHRSCREYPWTKVAYRYCPQAVIVPGNHLVVGAPGAIADDALLVHELKFRSFAQFERKIRRRIPWDAHNDGQPGAPSEGMVIGGTRTVFVSQMTDEELVGHWNWLHEEVEESPVPSAFRPAPLVDM